MNISLCMIVKNEEENINKCLKSVADKVGEIIIVDTGSKDATKEIAYEFTNKVYDFKWCDDFSKARNFAISKATNDWILVLDADEIVFEFNENNIIEFIKLNQCNVGRIKRINVIENERGTKRHIERINRLFNKSYYSYEGTIHEQIVPKNINEFYEAFQINITVEHIGYTREALSKTNKVDRNINLLISAIKANTNDPYLHYQLGKSYFLMKDYVKAAETFKKALSLNVDFNLEYVEDLINSFGYSLINSGKFTEALEIRQYFDYYNFSSDYSFLMGIIYMNNAMFSESIELFLSCIGKREGTIEGINSYLPNYNIGVIYECLGYVEKAIFYYEKCNGYSLANERLFELKNGK